METRPGQRRLHPAWWTAILVALIAALVALTAALFNESFKPFVPVTLTSDRSGLVMESGGKVKLRGVEVGSVEAIAGGKDPVRLSLHIDPEQIKYIPANVAAQIQATTAFGTKYVELIYPQNPSPNRLAPHAILRSRNVSTEVNTVFESLVGVLRQVDPAKLNATLTALAQGVRGQGQRMGQAITSTNQVLTALNPRMNSIQRDFQSFKGFSDAYASAAQNILATLNAAATTSATITSHAGDLDALLLNMIGFSQAGIDLLAPNQANLVHSVNTLAPTTNLLLKYNPAYTCMLVGAKYFLDNGGYATAGGDGKGAILDSGLLFGDDLYRYPDNLPIVAAKGGPGGKPGCGSLPIVDNDWPVRYLVTNTGWGTGLDLRPNPGIGHPFYADYLPVTRAVPEPPSIRGQGPPAIGPIPYPGAPPYGAPLYGPDGSPLYAPPPSPPPGPEPSLPPPP